MKKILVTFLMLGGIFLITLGSANAGSFTFNDTKTSGEYVTNWSDQPTATETNWGLHHINWTTADEFGRPTVDAVTITTTDGFLTQLDFSELNKPTAQNEPDAIFISNDGVWNSWDYYIESYYVYNFKTKIYTLMTDFYSVNDEDDYTYTYGTNGRSVAGPDGIGHASGIDHADLTLVADIATSTYDGSDLIIYLSNYIEITQGAWIGFTPKCANDVTLNHIPEPTQMLLLGTALIGLAGIGRKKFFKK
jgi:hypothetical protein